MQVFIHINICSCKCAYPHVPYSAKFLENFGRFGGFSLIRQNFLCQIFYILESAMAYP